MTGAAFDDPGLVADVLSAARADVPIVSSYDYRHLGPDLAAGLEVTTGKFRSSYETAMTTTVMNLATKDHVVQTVRIVKAGIGSVNLDRPEAIVLLYGQQAVTNISTGPAPRLDKISIVATMAKSGGNWLISQLNVDGGGGTPPGTPDLVNAVQAGTHEVSMIFGYSRAHFNADYGMALAGTTGTLHADLATKKASTLAVLTKGGFDLHGEVSGYAVEKAAGSTVLLLIGIRENRVGANGVPMLTSTDRLEVTMTKVDGAWLASDLQEVGLN